MSQSTSLPEASPLSESSAQLFLTERQELFYSSNRFIGAALFLSWIAILIAASILPGKTIGDAAAPVGEHMRAALYLGFLGAGLPGLIGYFAAREKAVPYILSLGQMIMVGLVTHITDGHMETHFAYFGSLALLSSYREWRFLILASAAAAVDHVVRGIFIPYSIFGMHHVELWRIAEHALWVVWEDIFLLRVCLQGVSQLHKMATQSAKQKLAAEASAAQVITLLAASQMLNDVSSVLASSTRQLIAEAGSSLGQARTVSVQMAEVAGQVAEMDTSAKAICKSVGESSDRLSHSDVAAVNALGEVAKLVESSRQITEVLDTVQNLAFQTNLLSINAAIEAALAGEAGESFAVVAAEVRQLANHSRESAENIAQRIRTIQDNVDSVRSRLSEICESVSQVASLTVTVKESAQRQASTAAIINRTSSDVERSTQNMLQSMDGVYKLSETASGAAVRTSELAASLRALAEQIQAPAAASENKSPEPSVHPSATLGNSGLSTGVLGL
jgi:methyl-accepting chemotaxis protein